MLLGKISHLGHLTLNAPEKGRLLPVSLGPKLRLTGVTLLYKCIILKIYQPLGREGKVLL